MTLDEWKSITDGQIIYAASGLQREVIKGCSPSLCITLKAIRKTRYGSKETVYDHQCRRSFFLFPPPKNNTKIHSRVIQQQITVNEISKIENLNNCITLPVASDYAKLYKKYNFKYCPYCSCSLGNNYVCGCCNVIYQREE